MPGSHAGGFKLIREQFAAVAELTSAPGRQHHAGDFCTCRGGAGNRTGNEMTDHKEQTSGDFSGKSRPLALLPPALGGAFIDLACVSNVPQLSFRWA